MEGSDFNDIMKDIFEQMSGGKKNSREASVRRALSEMSMKNYNEYIEQNPVLKEELDDATKQMSGMGSMTDMMGKLPMDSDMFGGILDKFMPKGGMGGMDPTKMLDMPKYIMSGKDLKRNYGVTKMIMDALGNMDPEMRNMTDGFFEPMEMEIQRALKRDEVVDYLVSKMPSGDAHKKDTTIVSEESYADAVKSVFKSKAEYVECMSSDMMTDMYTQLMGSMGTLGGQDPMVDQMFGNMDGMKQYLDVKSKISKGVAKKEAGKIF